MQLDQLHERPALLLPEFTLLAGGAHREIAVLISAGVVEAVGPAAQLLARYTDVGIVRLPGRLLMPGMIDAHTHLTQSFGKSLVFGEPSEIFQRVWVPMEQFMDADATDLSTRLAAWESLRGGFTTVVDAGTRASVDLATIANAATDVGIRCVLGLIGNDLHQGEPRLTTSEVVAASDRHLSRWEHNPMVHASLAVSIPEAASDKTLVKLTGLAREAGVTFQTHVNEHLVAIERSLNATGMRPLERLAHLGALGPETLAAHATLLTPHEIMLLASSGAAISYNPVASSWKGNAVAPAQLLHELGGRFGLGTDGTRGDAFRLLDAAESAQRFSYGMAAGDSSVGGGKLWLDHALQKGADAIALAGRVGEITAGAYADLLVVSLDVPELVPSWDIPWELVRLFNRDQIESVIVHGRLRLAHGMPVDWDGNQLLNKARGLAKRIVAAAPIRKIHPMTHEAGGSSVEEAS